MPKKRLKTGVARAKSFSPGSSQKKARKSKSDPNAKTRPASGRGNRSERAKKPAVLRPSAAELRRLNAARGKRILERWRGVIQAEIANGITHGIGAGLSLAGAAFLIALSASSGWLVVLSFSIYGGAMALLYLASTLYHALPAPRAKRIFRILDHSAIYLAIAGSYTPFTLISIRGMEGYVLFSIVWALALAGIVFKAFFVGRWDLLSTIIYILMGWMAIFAWPAMYRAIPAGGLTLIISGGVAYTAGTLFYAWHRLPFHHAIWHLFVLAGSVLHYLAVFLYVKPV